MHRHTFVSTLPACMLLIFFVTDSLTLHVDVSPREATVLENRNVSFRCQMGVALQYCRVEIPGIGPLNLNNKFPTAKGVSYTGAGLGSGQCGFTIERVTADNNGKISCYLGVETQPEEAIGTMRLTVAKAPRAPELELNKGSDSFGQYRLNDILYASCSVKDGRPVANISWYIDDEPIYDGLSMPTELDYAKEDLHTKIQNLTRQLQASDNGRHLRCIATHPAIETESVAMKQLEVMYPPLPQGNPIDRFGYEIGRPGIINVEIEANPKPILAWTVRGDTIKEGDADSTGRIQAEFAQNLGRGRYVASLKIAGINKLDTEAQYVLRAYNDIGTQDYTIQISTSPEPEGLDLGAGGVIGIVIATLILLVVVFIVVLARIKGKWCFSGSDGDGSRAPVESSDTESADVRQATAEARRSIVPTTFTSLFKKKNDKVSHEEDEAPRQMETEDIKAPLEEEQKQQQEPENREGLVYAELDLINTNLKPVLKNEDEKTEYAEIVYTNDNKQPS